MWRKKINFSEFYKNNASYFDISASLQEALHLKASKSNHMVSKNLGSEICLASLMAMLWLFDDFQFPALITIIVIYYLLIIITIIITKSHNDYCSVGVMECILD